MKDGTELGSGAARVREALGARGLRPQVVEMPEATRTAAQAAEAVGCSLAQIAKSIIFRAKDSGRHVLVVTSGANRVDTAKVEALLGEAVGKADADFVRAKTGYAIGGVPPLGHAEEPVVFLDRELMEFPTVWAAAGTPHALFSLTPAELARACGGEPADVAQVWNGAGPGTMRPGKRDASSKESKAMLIRKATVQDIEHIRAMHVASIRRLCRGWYTASQIEAWTAALAPDLYGPALLEKVFLVAEGPDGAIQGIGIMDQDQAEVCAVYVHPDHAGNGVGSGLLAEFEDIAQRRGAAGLVVKSTLNAKGFYIRNGYREDEAAFHCLADGTRLACIRMTKRIAPPGPGPSA